MEKVWELADPLTGGPVVTGWEEGLGHVLGPLALLIFLSNVSSLRMLLSLRGRGSAVAPRLARLFLAPVVLYGVSHVMTLYAGRHPGVLPVSVALKAVTAISWVAAAARLSAAISGLNGPAPGLVRGRPPGGGHDYAAVSTSGPFPRRPSEANAS